MKTYTIIGISALTLMVSILYPVRGETTMHTELATFGAGCFWGVESAFMQMPGVVKTEVGYTGGTLATPTYAQVCNGTTGHAEVVQLTFDPKKISYKALLGLFWAVHNPTTLNRQGADVGTQYRSVIFYHTPQQKEAALQIKKSLNSKGALKGGIVTTIEQASTFYAAEAYHQQYYKKKGVQPACHIH